MLNVAVLSSRLGLHWIYLLASLVAALTPSRAEPDPPAVTPPVQASMVALLASPERFHQKRVVTIGFFRRAFEESCLYSSEEAARNQIYLECIWLELSGTSLEPARVADEATLAHGVYVIVDGTFVMSVRGHMGRSSVGGINEVGRLDPWPPSPSDK